MRNAFVQDWRGFWVFGGLTGFFTDNLTVRRLTGVGEAHSLSNDNKKTEATVCGTRICWTDFQRGWVKPQSFHSFSQLQICSAALGGRGYPSWWASMLTWPRWWASWVSM
jgi:hypothetical protein